MSPALQANSLPLSHLGSPDIAEGDTIQLVQLGLEKLLMDSAAAIGTVLLLIDKQTWYSTWSTYDSTVKKEQKS